VLTDNSGLSPFERLLTLFTRVRPGEGRSTFLFFLHGFLLLFPPDRQGAARVSSTDFSAEVRAYGVAVIALVLMFVVPAWRGAPAGWTRGCFRPTLLTLNMLGFAAAAYFGISTSFTFFVGQHLQRDDHLSSGLCRYLQPQEDSDSPRDHDGRNLGELAGRSSPRSRSVRCSRSGCDRCLQRRWSLPIPPERRCR
jgi:hypothetical protein